MSLTDEAERNRQAGRVGVAVPGRRTTRFTTGSRIVKAPTAFRRVRTGAVNAGTVFAVTAAIIAGLAIAWGVKVFVLDRKPAPAPKDEPKFALAVAAVNIPPRTEIVPSMVKTIQVSKADFDKAQQSAQGAGTELLKGTPVGRTTLKPIYAEDSIVKNQFEALDYPQPVASLIGPGKTSVIVAAPSASTMLQKEDHCDVLCTLANDTPIFGPSGSGATATLAKDLRVVARFGSTRTAVRPPPGPTRTYTLEADPWQAAVIELAKSMGATFSLNPRANKTAEDVAAANAEVGGAAKGEDEAYKTVAERYAKNNRVTAVDLALLFGVRPVPPQHIQILERLAGNTPLPPYAVYTPPSAAPAAGDKGPTQGIKPADFSPDGTGAGLPEGSVGSQGFHGLGGCPTCGKKH
jgi:Flp pilus assembly protein CpaB